MIEADRDLQRLLVAERSTIFANAKSELFQGLVKDYEESLKQSEKRWNKYKALKATAEEREIVPKYEEAKRKWKLITRKVIDGRIADTREGRREALDLTLGIAKEKFEEMRSYLDQLTKINLRLANDATQASQGIKEVNKNVAQSSTVSSEIARDISEVNRSAGEMVNSGSQVQLNAEELKKLSEKLNSMVGRFKV